MLNDVHEALSSVDEHVYYGSAAQHPKDKPWDYIVFHRDTLDVAAAKAGYTDIVCVAIVRENYVPDDVITDVIDAVSALPGFTLAKSGHEYWYAVKPGTQLTVERLVLRFTRARKL